MSLTAGDDYALDAAVTNSVNAGITYVVAAGNDGVDACLASPARAPGTLTVGATPTGTTSVRSSSFGSSNWGGCVDVWAPGLSMQATARLEPTRDGVPDGYRESLHRDQYQSRELKSRDRRLAQFVGLR